MRIGQIIKSWRTEEDHSVREGAKRLGVDTHAMLRIETGKPVSGENLKAFLQSEPVRAEVSKKFKIKAEQWEKMIAWLFS